MKIGDRIKALKALAALTDQQEKAAEPPKRGLWARLVGYPRLLGSVAYRGENLC
jgi:hypothetical protein